MKLISYTGVLAIALLLINTGCQKLTNPLDTEQYQKSVYLVGANQSSNEGVQIVTLPYKASASDTASTYISVATGGSLTIDHDVTVQIKEAGGEAVQRYNSMYLYKASDIKYSLLDKSLYQVPDYSVALKAGAVYGRMPIAIRTATLHPDSLYAMSFSIASVSDPSYLSIRPFDSVLIFSFSLYNDYSGTYQSAAKYYTYNSATVKDTVALSLTRTFKAINYNTVRFYHLATTENISNVTASGVNVRVESDNSLTISPWGSLVISGGGGTYDPVMKLFTIWYNYVENGVTKQFKGTFSKSLN